MTTVDHADIRGLGTTLLASVGCLPHSRDENTFRPHNAAEGYTKPGLRLFRETLATWKAYVNPSPSLGFRWHGNLFSNGPHEGAQFSGNGDNDLIGIFAFGHQLAIAFAEPYLGLPADGLDRCGELLQTQLQVSTDCGRVPVGPSTFDQGMTRMSIPSFGNAALLTTSPTGIFRGRQPQIIHELSGIIEARQVAQFGHRGHCDGELDTPQSLEGLDHRS